MANHVLTNQYNDQLRKIEVTDPVHADLMNQLFGQLINNDAFMKALMSAKMNQSTGHKHTGATDDAPQIGTAGIQDGAVTPRKLNLGGGFEIWYSVHKDSIDFEAPVNGIPFVHTDTAFTGGLLTNMENV